MATPVWPFVESAEKYGGINNPRWTESPEMVDFSNAVGLKQNTENHTPCGHWHKRPVYSTLSVTKGKWWQQSFDIGGDGFMYIGAPNWDNNQMIGLKHNDTIDEVLMLTDVNADDEPVINGITYDSFAGTPPAVVRAGGMMVLAAIVWQKPDGDSDLTNNIIVGVKRDGMDQYWTVAVNKLAGLKAGLNNDLITKPGYFMEAYGDGNIIVCYSYQNLVGGTTDIVVVRSTDYGVTWGSEVLVSSTTRNVAFIKVGDDTDMYIGSYYNQTAKVYISSDKGASWAEKDLPDLLIAPTEGPWGNMDLDTDVAGDIYVSIPRSTFTSIYVSTDGGASWNRYDQSEVERIVYLTANDQAVVIQGYDAGDGHYLILRSTDGGQNFSEVYDLTANGYTSIAYQILKHNGIKFAWTECGMRDNNSWLAWLESDDNGATWEEDSLEEVLNFLANTGFYVVNWQVEVIPEPAVWPMG